jgi:hypothetical protein
MLKLIWKAEVNRREMNPPGRHNPYFVELASSLERALAFATTGNAKLLHRGTMEPLFLSTGIISNGFPAIHRDVWRRQGTNSYSMHPRHWPTKQREGFAEPVLSSLTGLTYYYGKETAYVSYSHLFDVLISVEGSPYS